ncbi:hypothetical protein Dimus_007313 [Dionaea muscipula]
MKGSRLQEVRAAVLLLQANEMEREVRREERSDGGRQESLGMEESEEEGLENSGSRSVEQMSKEKFEIKIHDSEHEK